jgi:hypothetical protein
MSFIDLDKLEAEIHEIGNDSKTVPKKQSFVECESPV